MLGATWRSGLQAFQRFLVEVQTETGKYSTAQKVFILLLVFIIATLLGAWGVFLMWPHPTAGFDWKAFAVGFILFGASLTMVGVTVYVVLGARRVGELALEVSPNPARLGEEVSVRVRLRPGQSFTAERLAVRLVGHERTRRGGGKEQRDYADDRVREERVLQEHLPLRPGTPYEYSTRLRVPPDAMHTLDEFLLYGCTYHWTLNVQVASRDWPDVEREFPLTVLAETAEVSNRG